MKNICVICNKEFDAIKSTKKYCSDDCRNAARRITYANRPKKEKNNFLMPEKKCLLCGAIFRPINASANLRSCCYECMPQGVQLTRGMFLAKIKQLRGGKCVRCGYDICISALEFHHLNPNEKDFTISNDHFKLEEAIKESEKCILLCSNCHKEFHANLWDIVDLKEGGSKS